MAIDPAENVDRRVLALQYDENNKPLPAMVGAIVTGGEITGYLPLKVIDNGDGTSTLKVDTELTGDVTIGDIKTGSSDGQTTGDKWLKVLVDGTLLTRLTDTSNTEIDPATEGTLANILAQLDVALSTRASEATVVTLLTEATFAAEDFATETTLALVKTAVQSIDTDIDVALSTRASELTLAAIKTQTDKLTFTATRLLIDGSGVTQPISAVSLPLPTGAATEVTLSSLNSKDFATQTTLALIKLKTDNLDVALSTRATEATLALIKAKTDNLDVALSTRASELTLAAVKTQTDKLTFTATRLLVDGSGVTQPISAVSLPLPTGAATEATLGTLLTLAGFQARINTLGQKTMAASTPVVLASDQAAIPVTITTSTATAITSISRSAANQTFLAVNTSRKGASIQNDSGAVLYLKMGATATSASYTVRMASQDHYEVPFRYTGIIDGIWASAGAGAALVTEFS